MLLSAPGFVLTQATVKHEENESGSVHEYSYVEPEVMCTLEIESLFQHFLAAGPVIL